jgi:hypothetical protein
LRLDFFAVERLDREEVFLVDLEPFLAGIALC